MIQERDLIEMTVPAKPEYVGVIRLTVSGIANRVGYSYDEIEDIKIAVAEACTNVVDHAYTQEGLISVSFQIYEDRLEVIVADRGRSFNVEQIRETMGPINGERSVSELKEGGLGLFLINTLMDKVEISEENGVVLVMTKFLQRDGVERYVDETSATKQEQ
ncbi:anti-sigma B factor RsbW [Alkalihalobacillus sp. LMS39]|uniref:anti-sigma B factor RsbW n=1 Tax=Alkalihalobacillus sp. LMS39 TaxID=2924032 RepID=UPI001FB268D4|nr:anti-sigma B factor RsbW [Alkalihalobacillus sp. LMS39]UOE94367.1 anti-sigma B factor RsbW [Alkalihalobacillus sp. LMS39]